MVMLSTIWVAPTSAGEDDVLYYFPVRMLVGNDLAAGRWPGWDPYEQCGTVLFGDPQVGVLYPSTWLFAVMPPKLAYSLNVFIAFALAGSGAYLYLRKIGLACVAALFGATAFQYCGFLVGHRVHLTMISVAPMLGFGLWAIESLRDRPRGAMLALPGIVFVALAGGHWPTFINLMLIWSVYLLVRGRPFVRSVALAGAGVVVGVLLAAPQILGALDLLGQTTRQRIGYATAGENSFLPTNAVLALFPFLMGCRTQNFFTQPWWGAWHLCETLGYVGLLTLSLALAGIWRLWRRGGGAFSPLVKLWTLLAVGAGVWMLGYYLPTYHLIHALPVLNIVRAPARMVMVVDFALATLAAITIHTMVTKADGAGAASAQRALSRSVVRWAVVYLPICMAATLALVAAGTAAWQRYFPGQPFFSPFAGGPQQAWASLQPANPAVWVPLVVLAASAIAAVGFARRPGGRAPLLVIVLIVDLLVVARYVDVPARLSEAVDPTNSRSAQLIRADAQARGDSSPFRVLSLSESYSTDPTDTLAPKASAVFGIENLAGYGPFQYKEHAHLFGMRIFGYSRDWPWLIRGNYLLSLFNVRYVVAQEGYRGVIESVVVPDDAPAPAEGPNLLGQGWSMRRTQLADGTLTLRTPFMWDGAVASQAVSATPGGVYRIALDARAPQGASNYLQAQVYWPGVGEDSQAIVYPEQIGRFWRHFEWTFQAPPDMPGQVQFLLATISETPIEVRDVRLGESSWERPINLGGKLQPGERVYRLVGQLPPRVAGQPPVSIYENLLCLPRAFPAGRVVSFADNESLIEELRWRAGRYDLTRDVLVAGQPAAGQSWTFASVPTAGRSKVGAGDFAALPANGHGMLVAAPAGAAIEPRDRARPGGLLASGLGLGAWLLALVYRKRMPG